MHPRRRTVATLATFAALMVTISACDDPTMSRAPSGRHPGTQPACLSTPDDPDVCYYPVDPVVDPTDRALYGNGDDLVAEADRRSEMSTAEVVALENQQGYPSLRAYLDPNEWTQETAKAGEGSDAPTGSEGTALEKDGVTREDFPVGDGILSVLNSRGEIQVGDSVYKLTRDNAYAVHVRDLELLRQEVPTLSSPAPTDGDPRIVVQPVESTDREEQAAASSDAVRADAAVLGFTTSNCYWQSGDYRMHGKSYITNALFYSEAGLHTDWERRKKFLFLSFWSNAWQAGTLGVEWATGSLRISGLFNTTYLNPPNGNQYQSGTASTHRTLLSGWFKTIRGSISGTHVSSIGTCYTYVAK